MKHHVIPRAIGGSNSSSNLIKLCWNCHRRIHRLPFYANIKKRREALQDNGESEGWPDPASLVLGDTRKVPQRWFESMVDLAVEFRDMELRLAKLDKQYGHEDKAQLRLRLAKAVQGALLDPIPQHLVPQIPLRGEAV